MVARALAVLVSISVAGCAVDPYLTCGDKCADGSTSDAKASDGSSSEASSDGGVDASMCGALNSQCQHGSDCCSGSCSSNNRCVAACLMMDGDCDNGTCCQGLACFSGKCGPCVTNGNACMHSSECCSSKCSFGGDGGMMVCIFDN